MIRVLPLALVGLGWHSEVRRGSVGQQKGLVRVQVSRVSKRSVALVATLVTAVGLLVAVQPAAANPQPPPNPTNGQLSVAQQQKNALARQVGDLTGQIADAQAQLKALQGKQELAEQKYALAMSNLQIAKHKVVLAKAKYVKAKAAAATARDQVDTAQRQVTAAHVKFVQHLQATYMGDDTDGSGPGSLLVADDPNALLEQSALAQYQSQYQMSAVDLLRRATVAKSNADAAARRAVAAEKAALDGIQQAEQDAELAATNARNAKTYADNAVTAEQNESAALQTSLAARQHERDAAQLHLATLNNERTTFLKYQAHQRALARARARARALARARARARARERAREQREHQGGGSSGGGSSSPGPSAPSGGGWTAAKGQQAANRALSQRGTPYAWAAGNPDGPTRGVCDAGNGAPNDCYVTGYDCSGLAMYAWGQWWAHYAATQFSQAGRFHPSSSQLMPGDLIFWSFNGAVSGIHHVAIYIGGGQIVEAPYSGGYVQVASLYEYGSYFGATRPES